MLSLIIRLQWNDSWAISFPKRALRQWGHGNLPTLAYISSQGIPFDAELELSGGSSFCCVFLSQSRQTCLLLDDPIIFQSTFSRNSNSNSKTERHLHRRLFVVVGCFQFCQLRKCEVIYTCKFCANRGTHSHGFQNFRREKTPTQPAIFSPPLYVLSLRGEQKDEEYTNVLQIAVVVTFIHNACMLFACYLKSNL